MSEMHQDALAHLNYGVSADGCIILLTGEVGTGKTTICRFFLEQIDDRTDVAVILNPKLKAIELLASICDEFRIPVNNHTNSVKHYIDALNQFLLQTHAQNRRSILIIDEAQNLDKGVLEMVRMLTNLETSTRKLLKIFLLGQSELSTMLARPDMTQISQRITGRFHLKGLHLNDVDRYIKHRITVAGGGEARQLFDNKAVRLIHRLSGGIPRLINNICDRSLLGAYAEEKIVVNSAVVKKASAEVIPQDEQPKSLKGRLKLIAAASIAFILLIVLWFGTVTDHFDFDIRTMLSPADKEQIDTLPETAADYSSAVAENETMTAEETAAEVPNEPVSEAAEQAEPEQNAAGEADTRILINKIEITN